MKPKQIPKVVKAFLLLLGIWGGTLSTMILMSLHIFAKLDVAFWVLLGQSVGSMALVFLIECIDKTTLNEWGIGTPKKEKKQ